MFPPTARFADHDAGLVEVSPGTNTLTIGGGWNYYEIDCVTLTPSDAIPPPRPVPAALVDGQATPAARALMAELVADYGKVTWSGQHELIELDHLVKTSGKKPVILSGDLMFYSPARVERQGMPGTFMPRDYLDALMDAVKNDGYVLSLCWHWDAPTNHVEKSGTDWYLAFRSDVTTFDVAAALAEPESAEYALLLRDIDAIAVQLKKVAAADIPVLWRPLHESEGGWFWWGAKGPDAFKKLWRLVYQRLTGHHDLHNLIWVLASEDPEWYPGDEVVDIVGADKYPPSMSDPLSSTWEGLKAQYDGRKLIALTETGGMPDIEKMHQFGVWWSFFIPWSSEDGPASAPDATVQRIYQSPGVLTLDERTAR
jgi:mannan endo-1,4-beta-mannosidase